MYYIMCHITYYILCNIQAPGTLSRVSCLLVASPTERDQPVTFVLPQGRFMAYSLLPAEDLHG